MSAKQEVPKPVSSYPVIIDIPKPADDEESCDKFSAAYEKYQAAKHSLTPIDPGIWKKADALNKQILNDPNITASQIRSAQPEIMHALDQSIAVPIDPELRQPYLALYWVNMDQNDPEAIKFQEEGLAYVKKSREILNAFFEKHGIKAPQYYINIHAYKGRTKGQTEGDFYYGFSIGCLENILDVLGNDVGLLRSYITEVLGY